MPPHPPLSSAAPPEYRSRNRLTCNNTLVPSRSKSSSTISHGSPMLLPGKCICVSQSSGLFLVRNSIFIRQGSPSLLSPLTPSAPHPPVCIQHVPACARKAKDTTKLVSLSSFQKNGPIHSCNHWEDFLSGSLETAKNRKQQPASGLCCHWPKQQ